LIEKAGVSSKANLLTLFRIFESRRVGFEFHEDRKKFNEIFHTILEKLKIFDKELDIVIPQNADVLVVDTETRELNLLIAQKKLKKILEALKIGKNEFVYKKIDSTLRGNIGSEIETVMKKLKKDI